MPSFVDEVLAPLIIVISCASLGEVTQILRRIPFFNRVSAWTNEPEVIQAVINGASHHGLLRFNLPHVEDPLFGGPSGGPGRTGGPHGESGMMWVRTTVLQTICCPGIEDAVLRTLGASKVHGTIPF